jgi:hypothetical protein
MRRRALLSDGGTTKLFTGLLKYGCKVTIREYVDSGGANGVIHMSPTAWTMSAVEAAIFLTIVLGLAGAGTWFSVG